MKLELGSGDNPTEGFVHLDIRPDAPDVDVLGDVTEPLSWRWKNTGLRFTDTGLEEIRATHLLEHVSHRDVVVTLRAWRELLAPDGRLFLEVPNLTGHINKWNEEHDDALLVWYLFGEQDHEFNYHKTMFTVNTLRASILQAGFRRCGVHDSGLVLVAEALVT